MRPRRRCLVIRSARITSGNVGQPAVEGDAASSAYTPNRIVKSPGYSSDRPAECGVTDRRPQAPVEQGRDVAFDAKDNFVELILSADKAAAYPIAAGGVCAADGWNRKSIVDVAPEIADETAQIKSRPTKSRRGRRRRWCLDGHIGRKSGSAESQRSKQPNQFLQSSLHFGRRRILRERAANSCACCATCHRFVADPRLPDLTPKAGIAAVP